LVPLGRKAVVNNLDACVLTIDRDHRLIDTNESTRRLFDFGDKDDIVGRNTDDVFSEHPDFREFYSSITDGSATASSPVELDDRYYRVEVVELGNSGEAVLGRTIIMRDVTDQTLRRQELKRKNDQLERFAKVLSHDLRNPLNVASARLQLAREEPDAEHFEAISDAHDRMEALIDDVLTVTKEGETVSNFEPIDLADFIETCWFNVETEAATLRIRTDRQIQANPIRVRQLFENLFRNAVEHGGEDVTVTIGDLPDGFYVEDDGPGIADEDRDQIFEMGYTTGQGTGFGLNIVERIATAHGWQVEATEGNDGGARFEFTDIS
jgi:signal transduction histidine kinase